MSKQQVTTYHPRGSAVGELMPPLNSAGLAEAAAQSHALMKTLMTTPVQRYRVLEEVQQKIKLAALSAGKPGTGGKQNDLFYRWEAKNRKTGKSSLVMGPTIVCARLVERAATNCGSGSTCALLDDRFLFNAWFLDRETGNVIAQQFLQPRNQMSAMGDDEARQEQISFAIGQSKAIRNVIRWGLEELCDYAVEEAERQLIVAVEKDPKKTLERIMAGLSDAGIAAERVVRWLGRGMNKWEARDLVRISAALAAVNERTAKADEIWPDPELEAGPPSVAPPKGSKAKAKGNPPAEDPQREQPPPADDVFPGDR